MMEFDLGWPAETVAFLIEQGIFAQSRGSAARSQAWRTIAKPVQLAPLTLFITLLGVIQ